MTIVWAIGCSKPEANELGDRVLEVQVYHHAEPVANCDVYLMEYAEDFPGEDLSTYHFRTTSDDRGKAMLKGLLPGYHWINGRGMDAGDSVKGNRAIYIDPKDNDNYSKVILQVSEKH